ncbi:MAG: putative toxin-antitoxin system toxin component, PIN family, partial [Thermodesulfobacteriota bacterium]|nr:putative toxin-antitoxin system toxin component, PIN family [Thermodesulfobacteriota bacterium]
VFISGIFFNGPPSIILQAWRNSNIKILLSKEILEEYQRVAKKLSSKFSAVDIDRIIELLTIYGEVFETKDISVSVCEDLNDNKFIECAIASSSKLIVSGDKHLLNITGYQGISVLKPKDFIDNHLK